MTRFSIARTALFAVAGITCGLIASAYGQKITSAPSAALAQPYAAPFVLMATMGGALITVSCVSMAE